MSKFKKLIVKFVAALLCMNFMFLDSATIYVVAKVPETTATISNEQIVEALSNAQIIDSSNDSTFELTNTIIDTSNDVIPSIVNDEYYENCFNQMVVASREETPTVVDDDIPGDAMVYYTQKWLNQEYGDVSGFGSVPENGKTGWPTIYGLIRALQHELGITSLVDNFGTTTQAYYSQNILSRQDGVTNNMFAIVQCALWCKGYSPGYNFTYNKLTDTISIDAVFDETVENAVIKLKKDAGLIEPDGVVTLNTMKALLSMDAFQLLSAYGGKEEIRNMQQKLNRKYEDYIGLMPCDGVYGRNTNKAIIYALQAEEGLPVGVANGNFGNTTKLCCPQIPYTKNSSAAKSYPGTDDGTFYTSKQITAFTELVQFSLFVNGFGDGIIDGNFSSKTQKYITEFQEKHKIAITGKADLSTWLSLLISCGDTSRSALACDCATILTKAKAKTLYDNGYRYVGRYLTGTYNGGISKAITRDEAQIIFDSGLNFFPIYQTSARSESYFTESQGVSDAEAAIVAANKLGIPEGTIIYFAVDFDSLDYQITNSIIPYFAKVSETLESQSNYKTGIYGTRNACIRVSEEGYACSSFVGDMSTGFSGNLGFTMPNNWAFDQFATVTIGSGDGRIEIDKDGVSGRDQGVGELSNEKNTVISASNFNNNEVESDTLDGPVINILGYQVPLFSIDIGFSLPNNLVVETDYDEKTQELNVLIGIDLLSYSEKVYGERVKISGDKFKHAVRKVDTMVTAIGKNDRVFKTQFSDFKGSLYDRGFKCGFNSDAYFVGYMTFSFESGEAFLTKGELGLIARTSVSWEYPIVPTVGMRFQIEGNFETGLTIYPAASEMFDFEGRFAFDVKPSVGVGLNAYIANAYAGLGGKLSLEFDVPLHSLKDSFKSYLSASFFFEYNALKWGNRDEWTFAQVQLYPKENFANIISKINTNSLKLIQPIAQGTDMLSLTKDTLKSNVQVYTKPQILNLGNNKMFMAYIDDVPERTVENSTALMFTIYDGSSWSEPQMIFDDGTADFEPSICCDANGGVHIIWQNSSNIFDNTVTLDEMATSIELYYTYWNGSSFEKTTAITNSNQNYEMNHKVACYGNDVVVVWKENSENDVYALKGSNSISRIQCIGGKWQDAEIISTDLSVITSLDTSFVDSENVIAYICKSSNNNNTINDLELYYYNGQTIRLTNDSVSDFSAIFLNESLYWISDKKIVSIEQGDINTKKTVLDDTLVNVSDFDILSNTDGTKALIWEYEDDTGMTFYSSKYNIENQIFENAIPMEKSYGVVRGWDACLTDEGETEIVYCYADYIDNSEESLNYGNLSLIQKSIDEYCDLQVDMVTTCNNELLPGAEVLLNSTIYNNGSQSTEQFSVNIFNSEGSLIDSLTIDQTLNHGESIDLEIPVTLPANIARTDYTIQILPVGGEDIQPENNVSVFSFGYADIMIESITEEHIENGRKISAKIKNIGYKNIDSGVLSITNNGSVIENIEFTQIEPGEEQELLAFISDEILGMSGFKRTKLLYVSVSVDCEEMDYANNQDRILIYPDFNVSLTSGKGGVVSGSGTYKYADYASIKATPSRGYVFDGWYENDKLVSGLPQNCSISIYKNRNLEAKFKKLEFKISHIVVDGEYKANKPMTIIAKVIGGTSPYIYSFNVYSNNILVFEEENTISNIFSFTPTEYGSYTVEITVTDYLNNRVTLKETIDIKYCYKVKSYEELNLSARVPKDLNIISWSSDEPNIAEVNESGVVIGKKIGKTTIMAIASNGSHLYWEIEITYNWWQIFLMFFGIGVFMIPFWVAN